MTSLNRRLPATIHTTRQMLAAAEVILLLRDLPR